MIQHCPTSRLMHEMFQRGLIDPVVLLQKRTPEQRIWYFASMDYQLEREYEESQQRG